jgi:archaellum component FlaG (FlaF/FlaG flagellin family)
MVKYIISIKKTSGGSNKFYATEMTVLVDGTNVSVSEYGTIDNDGNIGTISVSRVNNTVALTVTPVQGITPITVRYARMGLKA